ncbi:hypothetical protein [Spirosoma panaciterrae]|uniref:hypothetical protein n=1 Tax=Spirosoma panaciterrae TaxID=496058 RepID=UPI000376486E|nr:hypothetical protein [Spirosoma panaciterrae]
MKTTTIFKVISALSIILAVSSTSVFAQLKVGNNPGSINPSAVLEVESTNKGFLPPRVALTSITDVTTIPSPATGLVVVNTANAGTDPNDVEANTLYMWNGTKWDKLISQNNSFNDNTGTETRKIQYYGDYQPTKTVFSGPFEFRTINNGSGGLSYQCRLTVLPTGNVTINCATVVAWGGVGGTGPFGGNSVITFTVNNWNNWQMIGEVTTALNGHNVMMSVESSLIPGWNSSPLFYNLLTQRIGGTASGLKTLVINRY